MPKGPNPSGLCMCGCGQKTPLAPQTHRSTGWVKGEPIRYIACHHRHLDRSPQVHAVDPVTGCWNWMGHVGPNGYGKTAGQQFAHRVYYERAKGPVPAGLELDHLCSNRRCCNPAHLEAVTHAENSRRGRRSKINAAIAGRIRQMHAEGTPPRVLAPMFGLAVSTIGNIVEGLRWADPGDASRP